LRKKYTQLENFNADILVIQECENPKESTKQYQEWAKEYLWIGTNKNRGLGVFSKTKKIELLDWSDKYHLWKDEMLELFIPYSKSLEVGKPNVWLEYSDHMPITYLIQEKDNLC